MFSKTINLARNALVKDDSKLKRLTSKQQLLLRRLSRPSQQIQMNDRDLARPYFWVHRKANKTLLILGHLELKNVPHVSSVYVLKTHHKVSIKSPLLFEKQDDQRLLLS